MNQELGIMDFLKNKKIIFISILAMFLLASCSSGVAFAAEPAATGQGPLDAPLLSVAGFSYLLASAFGKIVFFAGQLTTWALNLNSHILETPTMRAGWVVSRDIANLGFVLAIILIAFMTILRLSSYQMKTVLWKLIVAALLVNFSLVIAGVFIDFAGVLTNFFLTSVKNPQAISESLANTLSIQKFLTPPSEASVLGAVTSTILTFGQGMVSFITNILFILIFTASGAIALGGLAAMLFIRFITLNILLILMPVAWLAWVLPGMSDQFGRWWKSFFRWTFFSPISSFFIYLAIITGQKIKDTEFTNLNTSAITDQNLSLLGSDIAQMIMSIGILIGGLIAANEMGIKGADATMKFAGTARGAILGGVGKATGFVAGAPLSGLNALVKKGTGKTTQEHIRAASERLSSAPIIGYAAQALNRQLVKGEAESLKKGQADAAALSKEARFSMMEKAWMLPEEDKISLINAMAEKNELSEAEKLFKDEDGKWKEGGKERFESFIGASLRKGGPGAAKILSKKPTYAGLKVPKEGKSDAEYQKAVVDAIKKAIRTARPTDIDLSPEEIKNDAVFFSLGRQYVKHLSKNPDLVSEKLTDALSEKIKEIKATVSKGVRALTDEEKKSFEELRKWDEDSPSAQTAHLTALRNPVGFTAPNVAATEKEST